MSKTSKCAFQHHQVLALPQLQLCVHNNTTTRCMASIRHISALHLVPRQWRTCPWSKSLPTNLYQLPLNFQLLQLNIHTGYTSLATLSLPLPPLLSLPSLIQIYACLSARVCRHTHKWMHMHTHTITHAECMYASTSLSPNFFFAN